MTITLFILALLPVILLGYYVYSNDTEKEPKKFLIKLFIGGLGSALLTVISSLVLDNIFPFLKANFETYNLFQLVCYSFVFVAFVEEVSKFIMTYLISYRSKEYDQLYDMIVYAVFVSLGFAWIENLLYVLEGGVVVAIFRLLLAVPAHAADGVFMGYYLSLSKFADVKNNQKLKRKYLLYSVLVPTLFHGLYDFFAYYGGYMMLIGIIVFACFTFYKANKKLKQMASIGNVLVVKFCSNCGASVENSNFCSNCGNKLK